MELTGEDPEKALNLKGETKMKKSLLAIVLAAGMLPLAFAAQSTAPANNSQKNTSTTKTTKAAKKHHAKKTTTKSSTSTSPSSTNAPKK